MCKHMIVKHNKKKEIEFSGRDLPSFLNSFWYFVRELQLIGFHDLRNTSSEEILSDDQGWGVVKNLDMDSTEISHVLQEFVFEMN